MDHSGLFRRRRLPGRHAGNQKDACAGIEACRRIRANPATAQTPVLMFSALSEEAEAARLAGADGMLPKPFNLPALAEAVKTFFAARTGS